jgi:GNAT superfamily N-acetyltransferase
MAEPSYRKATPNDAEAISAVIAVVVADPDPVGIRAAMSPNEVRTWIVRLGERGGLFVCEAAGGIVGFSALNLNTEDPTEDPASAGLGVWVLPSYRGKGIGTALAQCALEHAREQGFKRIRGVLPQDNEVALSFLSSIGALVPLYNPDARFDLPL